MTADRIETAEALSQTVMDAAYVAGWNQYVREQRDDLADDADERYEAAWQAARPDVPAAGLRVTREAVEAEWVPDFQRLREYAIDRFAESEKAREYAVWEHRWREQAEAERDFLRTEV